MQYVDGIVTTLEKKVITGFVLTQDKTIDVTETVWQTHFGTAFTGTG